MTYPTINIGNDVTGIVDVLLLATGAMLAILVAALLSDLTRKR